MVGKKSLPLFFFIFFNKYDKKYLNTELEMSRMWAYFNVYVK